MPPGSTVPITVVVENLGPDASINARLTVDQFGEGRRTCLDVTIASIAAGERRTLEASCMAAGYSFPVDAGLVPTTLDPFLKNNLASVVIDVDTPPDLIVAVDAPATVDAGLPYPMTVRVRNPARTAATNVQVTIDLPPGSRFDIVPEGCVAEPSHAVCSIGVLEPWSVRSVPEVRTLNFSVIAVDRSEAEVTAAVSAAGAESDHAPESNIATLASKTYRTFFVTQRGDSGSGSLRAAIEASNASCTDFYPCKVAFRIASMAAVQRIELQSPLPEVEADPIAIDGATQTRYFGDTNPQGPEVELRGEHLEKNHLSNGLALASMCHVTVRGLAIAGFPSNGILLRANDCGPIVHGRFIEENYIGVDATGLRAAPNARGIYLADDGPSLIARNVISGNTASGIYIAQGSPRIVGNVIGLTPDLRAGRSNGASGIFVGERGGGTIIRENYIAFSGHFGISLSGAVHDVALGVNSFQATAPAAARAPELQSRYRSWAGRRDPRSAPRRRELRTQSGNSLRALRRGDESDDHHRHP